MKQISLPRVFDYLDYRAFVSDWMVAQKSLHAGFSLRALTLKVGLASASFLSAVLKGKKNLGEEARLKLGLALHLNSEEGEYFQWLVQFNQTQEMEGKNYCFRQLQKFRASKAHIVGEGQFRYYRKWYYAAVWNWLALHPREKNLTHIGESLWPPISTAEAEEAVTVLLETGLLRKTANGFSIANTHITTAPEVSSLAVKNHILELNRLAGQMLEQVPAEQRQYNTLMFQVSPKGFATIKERIRLFQEELRDILDHDQGEDRIYTLSMSLFPNTQVKK